MPRTLLEKLYHSSARLQRLLSVKCLVEGCDVVLDPDHARLARVVPVAAWPGISEPTMLSHHG